MRMRMVNPRWMCNTHLLKEHEDLHDLEKSIKFKVDLNSLIGAKYLELAELERRHDAIVREMEHRGLDHNSELKQPELTDEQKKSKVDKEDSTNSLLQTCAECWEKYESLKRDRKIYE